MFRLACDARASIGESPLWHDEQAMWTDPVERRLLRHRPANSFAAIEVEKPVWSLAKGNCNAVLGTLDDRFCSIGPSGLVGEGPPGAMDPGCRLNDMTSDAVGGLWAGAMHRGLLATRGSIYHARTIDHAPVKVAEGLSVPNGMSFAADEKTLFVVDTLLRTLLAYPVEGIRLGEPIIVTDFLGLPGKPDGMVMSAEGNFWVAMWGGGCVVEIAPNGAMLRSLELPAPHVSSLCFAPGRLLVTTSRMRLSPRALEEYPASGGLFELDLEEAQ